MAEIVREASTFGQQFLLAIYPSQLLMSAVGVIFGMIWGAIPALSSTMAMALLIGFSASMELNSAILFLLGVYTGAVFGGSISAIFINIPGTPAAICTALEGFPLARKGEGGLALGTAIVGSAIGNVAGILCLMLLIPVILWLAVKFGAWEIFLLGLWGVAITGTLTSGEMPLKGWISGWLGLLISMVGIENIKGHDRFTFDIPMLMTGVSFVPILIGLFGLAEVLKVLPEPNPYVLKAKAERVIPSFSLLRKFSQCVLRSSLIGAFIGALPAMGADIASFTSYAVAKRRAAPEEARKYGKGSYEGIIASEVANNASIGGSLLPMLALGIPGSTVAAAFLGALNLHNVVVGPMINFTYPGLLHFVFAALIIANFFMYGLALVLARPTVRLLSLPRQVLMPIIVTICVMGAFATNNAYFDVYIMIIFGAVGYLMANAGFPPGPMVMGVILGPLVDLNLRRAMIIFSDRTIWDVLSRPLGDFLLILVLWTFYDGIFRRGRSTKEGAPRTDSASETEWEP